MKTLARIAALSALLAISSIASANAASISVPVKGTIEATGSVELIVTFYNRAVGGRELYTTTQTFAVNNNIYVGSVEVPDTMFRNREQAFFSVARPSAPAIALGERAQYTQRRNAPERTVSIFGCSLCFSCGGAFPVFSGAWNTTSSPQTQERGSLCAGAANQQFSDVRPFLCCQ